MKKVLGIFVLFSAFMIMSGAADAASTMIFDPSEYPEVPTATSKAAVKTTTTTAKTTTTAAKTTATKATTVPTTTVKTQPKETNGIKNLFTTTSSNKEQVISPELTQKETENFQNALLQLDSAQVDVRNTLLEKKTKYAEIDSNYKVVKAQRDAMKKEVKSYEKRVKSIEKAKEKIRKSMI